MNISDQGTRSRILRIPVMSPDFRGAGPADQPVYFIVFGKEKFCQVGTVLAGDAGDECFFHGFKEAESVEQRAES